MRFLFAWQRVDPSTGLAGIEGAGRGGRQLEGFELPRRRVGERRALPARCEAYEPDAAGHAVPHRPGGLGPGAGGLARPEAARGPASARRRSPCSRERRTWAPGSRREAAAEELRLSSNAARVREVLRAARAPSSSRSWWRRRACSPRRWSRRSPSWPALGMVTSDSFSGLRALITPSSKRKPLGGGRRRHRTVPFGIESAGRWALLHDGRGVTEPERVELSPATLLRATAWSSSGCSFASRGAAVAGAAAGLPAARGAGRDPRRAVRERHVGRAVRAARGGEPAARDPAASGRRDSRLHRRGGSAQLHRHPHPGRAHSRGRAEPDPVSRRRAGAGAGGPARRSRWCRARARRHRSWCRRWCASGSRPRSGRISRCRGCPRGRWRRGSARRGRRTQKVAAQEE